MTEVKNRARESSKAFFYLHAAGTFATLEPQHQEIGEFYIVHKLTSKALFP